MTESRACVVAAVAGLLLAACGGSGSGGSLNAGGANFAWGVMDGSAGNTVGTGTSTYPDGSSVTVGSYDGAAVFAAGTPQQTTLVPGTGTGVFLARYDGGGKLVWVKRAVGVGTVQAMGVVTHLDGSFSVTGFLDGTATFGEGEPNQTLLATSGNEDVFVAHYHGDGTLAWARRADGATGYEEATRIALRADGSIAITGLYTADMTLGTGEVHETTLPVAAGPVSGFVACYAIDGSLVWATSFEALGGASGWGLAPYSDGSLALCGAYAGDAVFGPGEPNQTALSSVGGSLDAFVARLDVNGDLLWVRSGGGAGDDTAYGVTVVPGNLVRATGTFGGAAVFGSEGPVPVTLSGFGQTTDDFVVGYDDVGNCEWAKSFGSTGYDFATSIASFSDGTFAVTGAFEGDGTFGPGEPGQVLVSTLGIGDHEVFVARFQPDGSLDWVAVTQGVLGSDNEGTSIAAIGDDTCVVTGYFVDAIQFSTGLTLFGHTSAVLNGTGDHDAFIARFNPNGK